MENNRLESLMRISCEQDKDIDYLKMISTFSQKCPSLIKNLTVINIDICYSLLLFFLNILLIHTTLSFF